MIVSWRIVTVVCGGRVRLVEVYGQYLSELAWDLRDPKYPSHSDGSRKPFAKAHTQRSLHLFLQLMLSEHGHQWSARM